MSIELKQLAKLVEIAEHDRTLDDRFDDLYTIAEYRDDLKAILARMQALEKAVASVAAIRSRFSSTPMMNGTVQFAGFHKGNLGGSIIDDELTAMNHAFAAIRKT